MTDFLLYAALTECGRVERAHLDINVHYPPSPGLRALAMVEAHGG